MDPESSFILRVTSHFLLMVIMSQRQLPYGWRVNPKVFSGSIDAHPGQHADALCIEPFSCLEWILVEVICATNCKNAENISLFYKVPCCQEDLLCAIFCTLAHNSEYLMFLQQPQSYGRVTPTVLKPWVQVIQTQRGTGAPGLYLRRI